jgi:hypothetical protein
MTTKKNILEDVSIPAQRKSIKNIPIPNRQNKVIRKNIEPIASEKTHNLNSNSDYEKINIKKEFSAHDDVHDHTHQAHSNTINLQERGIKNSQNILNIKTEKISIPEEPEEKPFKINYNNYINRKDTSDKSNSKIIVFVSIVILLLITGFILNAFKTASFTLYAKNTQINDLSLEIPIVNATNNTASNELVYKEIVLNSTAEIKSESDREELVQEKASGTITVYNEYSKEAQRLIQNTRFETPDGKIYRIDSSLTVPGYTESNGQKIAGQVDVIVYADVPGQNYNIGLTEFTVPGFKGQEQFDFFYAKSKTPMSGGYDGRRKLISEDKKEIARKELQARLIKNIGEVAKEQISSDYIYFNNPEDYTFGNIEQQDSSGNEVVLKMNTNAKFIVIDKTDLAKSIALNNNLNVSSNENIKIEDINLIEISLLSANNEEDKLKIAGSAKLIWQNDTEKIKQFVAGKKQKEIISSLLQEFGGVIKIENVSIKPFWSSTFPNKISRIKIESRINE